MTSRTPCGRIEQLHAATTGSWLVAVGAGLFLLIVAPVIIYGDLLADEYIICLRPVHEGDYELVTELLAPEDR